MSGTADGLKLLKRLVQSLEARDPYMRGHSRRVARYSSLMAAHLGLDGAEVERVRLAAALHDLGKLRTPISILHKPGRLTDEEYAVVKQHSAAGARMIEEVIGDAGLAKVVGHHHERLDGSGYPEGLAGESIPLASRIISVADTFDAITADRPYRSARPHKAALDILRAEAGDQLDGEVVAAFRSVYTNKWTVGIAAVTVSTGVRGFAELLSSAPAAVVQTAGVAAAGAAAALAPATLVSAPAPAPAHAASAAAHAVSAPGLVRRHAARPHDPGTRVRASVRHRSARAKRSERAVPGHLHLAPAAHHGKGPGGTSTGPATTSTGATSTPTPPSTHSAAGSASSSASTWPPSTGSGQAHGSGVSASATAQLPGKSLSIGGTVNQHGASVNGGVTGVPGLPPVSTTVSVPLPAPPHLHLPVGTR
ncbi:MAG TPA: HD-GYP domain-containing protein [Solirubrobacteraceae bacterium]